MIMGLDLTDHAHQFIFSFSFTFLFVLFCFVVWWTKLATLSFFTAR